MPRMNSHMPWWMSTASAAPQEASVDRPAAQAIFISCTDLRACEMLETIEKDTGKPALSSNQIMLWDMLKLAGVREPVKGYGCLLTRV